MKEFYNYFDSTYYITSKKMKEFEINFKPLFLKIKKNKLYIFSKTKRKFVKDYKKIAELVYCSNQYYIKQTLLENNDLLSNIKGHSLDSQQRECVVEEEDNILVIAGAGSGKSLTIIGKIRYLIETKYFEESEILCISFTNDSTNSLKESLVKNYNYNIDTMTFHKLALKILKEVNKDFAIASPSTLEYIINEFYDSIIFDYPNAIRFVVFYFNNNDYNYFIEYKKLLNTKKFLKFKKLIEQFIRLFKSNVFDEDYLLKYLKIAKYKKRDYCFISNIIIIYSFYKSELSSQKELDFDDMISSAIKVVKMYKLNLKYKYIIIDEYQDTSLIRCQLIQEIIKISNSKLMVVGDDFQSIYRFSGCNLDIFLSFHKYFPNPKTINISNTYRNSQELIDIAGNFVMKNKMQKQKKLNSHKKLDKPIKIIYYSNQKETFKKLIDYLIKEKKENILILGRNNNDLKKVLSNDFKEVNNKISYRNLFLKYLTVHKAKGLEEENVVIINLENDILGFPSKLEDDEILKYIVNYDVNIPYDEERRLFYVAITRTQKYNYLLVNKEKPSIFVKEIIKDYKENIEILSIN